MHDANVKHALVGTSNRQVIGFFFEIKRGGAGTAQCWYKYSAVTLQRLQGAARSSLRKSQLQFGSKAAGKENPIFANGRALLSSSAAGEPVQRRRKRIYFFMGVIEG
jgi:hypothetical protein